MKVTIIFLFCISALFHFSPGENVFCPSEGIIYVPHSKCTQFIICSDGVDSEMTCPFGLYYNPKTSQCDFPENVAECREGTRPSFTSTSTTTSKPPLNTLTQCGQKIVADNGAIQYKLNEPYDAGELCVFMIQFENGYLNSTFILESSGISDLDQNAISVFRITFELSLAAQLGTNQQNVTVHGYGAVVIFRTNTSSGTGFKLTFWRDDLIFLGALPGTYAFFNETTSHLDIPFPTNYTGGTFHSYFFFTAGHKIISEPNTFLNLTTVGVFRNENNTCANMFNIYSFENELKKLKMICSNRDDYQEFKFSTRGLFCVYQQQVAHLPKTTGFFKWKKASAT